MKLKNVLIIIALLVIFLFGSAYLLTDGFQYKEGSSQIMILGFSTNSDCKLLVNNLDNSMWPVSFQPYCYRTKVSRAVYPKDIMIKGTPFWSKSDVFPILSYWADYTAWGVTYNPNILSLYTLSLSLSLSVLIIYCIIAFIFKITKAKDLMKSINKIFSTIIKSIFILVTIFISIIVLFQIYTNYLLETKNTCVNILGNYSISTPLDYKDISFNSNCSYILKSTDNTSEPNYKELESLLNTAQMDFQNKSFRIGYESTSSTVEERVNSMISINTYMRSNSYTREKGALEGSVKLHFIDSKNQFTNVVTVYKRGNILYFFTLEGNYSDPNKPLPESEVIYDSIVGSFTPIF